MLISRQFLFLFSALGAVNGVLLALYFFSRRPRSMANVMLGGLLLAIGVRTGKSTFLFFNRGLAAEYLQLGLSACLLIGPLTYLYVHFHLAEQGQRTPGRRWYWHLVVSALVIGFGLCFPYAVYRGLWQYSSYGLHAYWLVYLLLAGRELWEARAMLRQKPGAFSRNTVLLLSVYFSSALILACYVSTPLTSYIVGALSFTFSVHVTILAFILRKESQDNLQKKEKYANRKLAPADAQSLLGSLSQAMTEQQLFLDPNLSLAQLARKAGSLPTTVSQVLNDNLDKSFNLYVNEFRIDAARRLLVEQRHLNMELVAERCGFNATSTFFSAFKKIVGQTPAAYRAAAVKTPG